MSTTIPILKSLAKQVLSKRDSTYTTFITELNIDDGYSVEIGYVQHNSQELYLRLWLDDEFIVGAWTFDFKNRITNHLQKLPESLTQKCVECADRVSKLTVFI